MEIDTSNIQQAPAATQSSWRAPRHIYFGKKGADGVMEEEPVYAHQSFPKMIYKMRGEVVLAEIVNNTVEHQDKLTAGWRDSPADFGIITAPSFDQIRAQGESQHESTEDASEHVAARRGRPPKVAA